jgi:hexokinase
VGTLLAGAYSTGGCLLGAIFGTGTNGAYVEDQGALKKLSGNTAVPGDGQKMIINCEWGAFDNAVSFLAPTINVNLLYHLYQSTAKSSPSLSIRHKARSGIHQSVCLFPLASSRDVY